MRRLGQRSGPIRAVPSKANTIATQTSEFGTEPTRGSSASGTGNRRSGGQSLLLCGERVLLFL